ncbi:MAG: amino acid ABC transporter permease, partial [SAR202 cluster bacterium]|nr:amino acid ABC transporter permease [SAR202 cluster bacterium]
MSTFNWIKANLLGSKKDILFTILTIYFIYLIGTFFLEFIFSADWTLVEVNRKILLVGLFPNDQIWRIWTIFSISSILMSSTIGYTYNFNFKNSVFYIVFLTIPILIFTTLDLIVNMLLITLFSCIAYLATNKLKNTNYGKYIKIILWISWGIFLPSILLILTLFGGPKVTLWGGFFVNIILAVIAILAGFPLGIILAIGRASSLPVVKYSSIIFIETFRGAPLIAWLFFAWFVLPNFLPDIFSLDDINLVIRAMIILSLFASAYIAEVIRGGLQSIPKGQKDASRALGIGPLFEMAYIVLPQAIRVVIPTIVSTFIAIFKDTSLVFILGITDVLRIGRLIPEQQQAFYGKSIQTLLVVALLFWIVSIVLSQISRSIEKK